MPCVLTKTGGCSKVLFSMENAHIMLEMAAKCSNYAKNSGLCFFVWIMLFEADHAKNCASILYQCLVATPKVLHDTCMTIREQIDRSVHALFAAVLHRNFTVTCSLDQCWLRTWRGSSNADASRFQHKLIFIIIHKGGREHTEERWGHKKEESRETWVANWMAEKEVVDQIRKEYMKGMRNLVKWQIFIIFKILETTLLTTHNSETTTKLQPN